MALELSWGTAASHTPVLPNICLCGDANSSRAPWSAGVCDVKCSRGKDLPSKAGREAREWSKALQQEQQAEVHLLCVCVYISRSIALEISHVFSKGTTVAWRSGRSNSKRSQRGYKSSLRRRVQLRFQNHPPNKSYTTVLPKWAVPLCPLPALCSGTSLLLAPRTGGQLDPRAICLKNRLAGVGGGENPK